MYIHGPSELYSLITDALYKATKVRAGGDVKTNARATVEDEAKEEEEEDDDVTAGPELPPDGEEQLSDDDEEGRFFGGGLTKNTTDVMNFIDEQDNDTVRSDTLFCQSGRSKTDRPYTEIREGQHSLAEKAGFEFRKTHF